MRNNFRVDGLLNKANSNLKSKNYTKAKYYFDKVLTIDSNEEEAIIGKAYCFYSTNRHIRAMELCNKINPNNLNDFYLKLYNEILTNNGNDNFHFDTLVEIKGSISERSNKKKCPFCGKLILKESIWCIYCNHYFEDMDCEYYIKNNKIDMYLLLNSRNRYSSLDDYVNILHWAYNYSFSRNLDDALICINQILEFYPNNPNYLYDKALIFNKLGKYDETLELVKIVMKLDNSIVNEEWYANLCELSKKNLFKDLIYNARKASSEEDFETALSCYNLALMHEPHNIYLLNNKAHLLLYLNNYDEAIKIFDSVLEIDFEYVNALLGKSYALYYSKMYKESLDCFNKIIEIFDGFIDYEFYNELFEKVENE